MASSHNSHPVALLPDQRPPRLQGDVYRYIRAVKGGRYQARPFCELERERYNLGLFPTKDAAAAAIRRFWATSVGDKPKFVRPIRCGIGGAVVRYKVVVRVGKYRDDLGMFDTEAKAVRVRDAFLKATYGPLAKDVLKRR